MNCSVSADFPTPPLPTMMTLWRVSEFWPLFLPEDMVPVRSVQLGRNQNRS